MIARESNTMENLKIEATDRSPEIDFDFASHQFLVKGESYPEDVTAFYGPVIEKLEAYFEEAPGDAVEFTFELLGKRFFDVNWRAFFNLCLGQISGQSFVISVDIAHGVRGKEDLSAR